MTTYRYWDDVFAELHQRALPLLAAAWSVTGTDRDDSGEEGASNSVVYDLERDSVRIELEYFEEGWLVVYPNDPLDPEGEDGEPSEPLFELDALNLDDCRKAFAKRGWLTT